MNNLQVNKAVDFDSLTIDSLRQLKEPELRKNIVIPLLEDYLSAKNVQDLHGNNEYGIDVYFEWNDIFSHSRNFGVQIKTCDLILRCGSDKNRNIQTICNQIKLAFSKKINFADSSNGKVSKTIDGFYIMTSGKTNDPAKNYIYEERKAYSYIHIIEGDELLRIIKNRELLKRSRNKVIIQSDYSFDIYKLF